MIDAIISLALKQGGRPFLDFYFIDRKDGRGPQLGLWTVGKLGAVPSQPVVDAESVELAKTKAVDSVPIDLAPEKTA